MIKKDEASKSNSCFNRAKDDEPVFVILARDVTAPYVINSWINRRLATGKNKSKDKQIREARELAVEAENWFDQNKRT